MKGNDGTSLVSWGPLINPPLLDNTAVLTRLTVEPVRVYVCMYVCAIFSNEQKSVWVAQIH